MLSWDEFNAQETPVAKPQPASATPPQSETVSDQAAPEAKVLRMMESSNNDETTPPPPEPPQTP